jgi:hypothetical protein
MEVFLLVVVAVGHTLMGTMCAMTIVMLILGPLRFQDIIEQIGYEVVH